MKTLKKYIYFLYNILKLEINREKKKIIRNIEVKKKTLTKTYFL